MAKACPLLSVTPRLKIVRLAPLLLVRSVNVTAWPPTALPVASVTVAVTMVLFPAIMDDELAVKLRRKPDADAELDTLVIVRALVEPVTLT
jgi:hypothetical protein